MEDIKNIIESIIFVSEEPISLDKIRKILPDADIREIKQGIIELIDEFETRKGGFHLREVAGGYQFRSRPEYRQWISYMVQPKPVRLSKAALETLAIIAYRQPIIRADVEHIRGVDSGGILRMLMERKLIRALGRKDIPGRPLIYATTKHFLELFDLKDLNDLPSLKEIEEFGKHEPESSAQETEPESVEEARELSFENESDSEQETEVPRQGHHQETISVSELASEIKAIVIPKIEIESPSETNPDNTDTKIAESPTFNYEPNEAPEMISELETESTPPPEDDIEERLEPKQEFKP